MSKGKRMGRVHYWVCRSILLLDRIPRYGRFYEAISTNGRVLWSEAKWKFWRRGFWGINILDRVGWLDLFIMESEYRHALKERHE